MVSAAEAEARACHDYPCDTLAGPLVVLLLLRQSEVQL